MDKDHDRRMADAAAKMVKPLPVHSASTRRRWGIALGRMTPLQRVILYELAVNDIGYEQLARSYDLTIAEVEMHFEAALRTLVRTFDPPEPWWLRIWARLSSRLGEG